MEQTKIYVTVSVVLGEAHALVQLRIVKTIGNMRKNGVCGIELKVCKLIELRECVGFCELS